MSALHEDLLFKIFLENTYAGPHYPFTNGDESPLTTALHCSQVCRQWRSIFLSSSSIWGRLIDLNGFNRRTDKWREEIFARTGEAVLWVYGFANRDVWDFLSPFLQQNWRRVQILVIREFNDFGMIPHPRYVQRAMLAFIMEPAPQLCRIDVDHCNLQFLLSDGGGPTSHFFGDDAPLLRHFTIRQLFPMNASWLSNLSSISFPMGLEPEEVLTTLRRMPRLDYLSWYIYPEFGLGTTVSKVVLPNLKMLQTYSGNIHDACTILECITPSPDCCLAFQALSKDREAQDDRINKQYENAVKSYIMPYFSLHPPSALEFTIQADFLWLADPTPPISGSPWVRRFCIALDISCLPSSLLIKELTNSSWLPNIDEFEFDASRWSEYPDGLNNVAVISALDAFSSSSAIIHTNDGTLSQLLEQPLSYTSTLFPALITLKIDCPWGYLPLGEEHPHYEFLKLRKAIGRPVSILDFGVLSNEPSNMGYLEEYAGLLVTWETRDEHRREYICGQGHPDRLRFSDS
ncbi:hypothetical protein CPC08DRAFT_711972 [Agrocybe pediades]|nr:hypothetical protein CPC08DRAFT_711972 [Agrocybe pediades]